MIPPSAELSPLDAQLAEFLERHPQDRLCVDHVRHFLAAEPEALHRRALQGHVTASSCVFDAHGERVLLIHHRKLDRWLQLGGHADGDPHTARVALREVREESGLVHLDLLQPSTPAGMTTVHHQLVDLDVHEIPARRDEPAHLHHDFRFAFRAQPGQRLQLAEAEGKDLRFVTDAELATLTDEESLLRLVRRARALLAHAHRAIPSEELLPA